MDTSGAERFTLHTKDLSSGQLLPEANSVTTVEWPAADFLNVNTAEDLQAQERLL